MGIKSHYLKDSDGNKFYPYAHANATFDSNGVKIGTRLDNIEEELNSHLHEISDVKNLEEALNKNATESVDFIKTGTATPTEKGNALLEGLTGDSWQKQLSGKNLWTNDATCSFTTMMSYQVNLIAGKTYTFSAIVSSTDTGADTCYIYDLTNASTLGHIERDTNRTSITFTPIADCSKIRLYASASLTLSTDNTATYKDIQIEEGTEATPYEPHCGCVTSPNPEYSQTIHSVGDMGWFDGEWWRGFYADSDVWRNSNIAICSVNKIPCKQGDKIFIKHYGILNDSNGTITISFFDENNVHIDKIISGSTDTELSTIAPSSASSFVFDLRNGINGTLPDMTAKTTVTINGKYAVIVDEVGKNLLNPDNCIPAFVSSNLNQSHLEGYRLSKMYPLDTYTLSWGENTSQYIYIIYYDNEKKIIRRNVIGMDNKTSTPVKQYEDASYFAIMYRWGGDDGTQFTHDIQLEKSDTVTPFEPYVCKRTYIPLDEPLRGIGDVKDELVPQDGLYGEYRPIGADVLDGSDDEQWNMLSGGIFFLALPNGKKVEVGNAPKAYCDQYICDLMANANMVDNSFKICKSSTGTNSAIWIKDSDYSSVDDFKAKLQANPIEITYVLEEPIFTPFEDQTPFYNIQSFDEVTHVSIAGLHEELQPTLTMRFPRHEDGTLATTAYCDAKKNEIETTNHISNSDIHITKDERELLNSQTHTHINKSVLDNTTASFTIAEKEKLSNISENANAYTLPSAGTNLGGVKTGGDATISNGVITVNDDSHNHVISNVDGLQSALDGKVSTTRTVNGKSLSANISLSYSDVGADASGSANTALTNAKTYVDTKFNQVMGEGASETLNTIGEISKAIEEHQDVTDALNSAIGNKANVSDLSSHTGNSNIHVTSTEKANIATAKTHADSAHAPSNAEKNQNAFSNVKVGSTTITADTTTDTLTLVEGSNITITTDATNDKITIAATDTKYTHPSYTAKSSGLYKITVDNTGHVSAVTAVAKSDITALGIPSSDTNTHYTSKNVVNNSASATTNTSTALTNGNVYLVSVENGVATSAHKISGSGATTVTTDASGNIVISSTDTNTTYTHPTYTARTGKPTANQTPAFGGTATVSQITSDATGHVTGATDRTITIPSTLSNGTGTAGLIKTTSTVTSNSGYTACPVISGVPYYKDTNTKNTAGSTNSSSKLFLVGATSQAANPQTYSHDTVYVGTDGCLYSNSTRVDTEITSSTEPTNQVVGDYWCVEY